MRDPTSKAIPKTGYRLDAQSPVPLFEQLYQQVRNDILAGRLRPGDTLPSSRRWAERLGVSRTTVLTSLDQLHAEGYIQSRRATEVRVSNTLPDDSLRRASVGARQARMPPTRPALPSSTVVWPQPRNFGTPHPFQMAVPAIDSFPVRDWGRLSSAIWRKPPLDLLNYHRPGGYPPPRRAIAEYLSAERDVECHPEQVIVTAGSQQALHLVAQLLLKPGDGAWIENPGYYGARLALERVGAKIHTIPVDRDGINVEAGIRAERDARLVYVTPSHQCPLGSRMSLERRLSLLHWARPASAWIVEDDYDSEYRYTGRPLAPLHALAEGQRVVYVGSFSLTLFPSLRIGFIVAPPELVDGFLSARALADWNSSAIDQAVLAQFIDQGMLVRHLRRMRMLYAERQRVLIDRARQWLSDWIEIEEQPTGLHAIGWLNRLPERKVIEAAEVAKVELRPMSMYRVGPSSREAVLFGFAPFDASATGAAVLRLREALDG